MGNMDIKSYQIDDEGFLIDWEKWDENFAKMSAKQDGEELTKAHWEIIDIHREAFKQYGFSLLIKNLIGQMRKKGLGLEKCNTTYLYKLFPGGPAKMSAKYAGIPKPTG